jgi:hypothetical protein
MDALRAFLTSTTLSLAQIFLPNDRFLLDESIPNFESLWHWNALQSLNTPQRLPPKNALHAMGMRP